MKVLFFLAIIVFIVQAQLDCEVSLSNKIVEFKKIPLNKRHEALEKFYLELRSLYPHSTEELAKKFTVAMFFQENTPASLCKLSESIFGSMLFHKIEKKPEPVVEKKPEPIVEKKPEPVVEKKPEIKEEEINPRCIFGCLRKKLNPQKFREVAQKCKFDRECWKKEAEKEFKECLSECQNFVFHKHHHHHHGKHHGRHHHHGKHHGHHHHGKHHKFHGFERKRAPNRGPWFLQLKDKLVNFFSHKEVTRKDIEAKTQGIAPKDMLSPRPHGMAPIDILAPKPQAMAPIDILSPKPKAMIQIDILTPKPAEQPKKEERILQKKFFSRKCVFKCVFKKLSFENFKKLFSKCHINVGCYKEELTQEFKGCKEECRTDEAPKGGKPICILKCFVSKLTLEKMKELCGKCKFDRKCWKDNFMTEYRACRESCKPKEETKKSLGNIYTRCMMACFRTKLGSVSFGRIYQQCFVDLDCWLEKIPKDFEACDEKCTNESNEKVSDQVCIEKVEKTKNHFQTLKQEEKFKFAKTVAEKLKEKFPNAKDHQVKLLVGVLFSPASSTRVCLLYKRLFQ